MTHERENALDPHFKLVLMTGGTKGVQQDGKKLATPCAKVTQVTGLRPGVWVKRLMDIKRMAGETNSQLLARRLRPVKLMEFEDDFYKVLEMVQETADLTSNGV
jgi:hypothetical protein